MEKQTRKSKPRVDLTGQQFGYLTPIEYIKGGKWRCQCKCGNEVIVLGKHLRSGNTKSCGCYQKERATESNLKRGGDLTGRRFGKLVVIEEDGFVTDSYNKRHRLWKCQCDCGNICSIQHQYLVYGDTNSCGCINSVGNMTINRLLNTYGVLYESEYSFKNFICNTKPYRFDFALFNNNKDLLGLIEYQGDIHFTYKNIVGKKTPVSWSFFIKCAQHGQQLVGESPIQCLIVANC